MLQHQVQIGILYLLFSEVQEKSVVFSGWYCKREKSLFLQLVCFEKEGIPLTNGIIGGKGVFTCNCYELKRKQCFL